LKIIKRSYGISPPKRNLFKTNIRVYKSTPKHPATVERVVSIMAPLRSNQIDLFEINEAFAAVPLVSSKILGDGDGPKTNKIREKLNVNGGAIAIGHPVGASGARLVMTLMCELRRRGGGHGVASICGGLSQGDALLLKVE
jgi:acetyl-CoA C-acetyltransferase